MPEDIRKLMASITIESSPSDETDSFRPKFISLIELELMVAAIGRSQQRQEEIMSFIIDALKLISQQINLGSLIAFLEIAAITSPTNPTFEKMMQDIDQFIATQGIAELIADLPESEEFDDEDATIYGDLTFQECNQILDLIYYTYVFRKKDLNVH